MQPPPFSSPPDRICVLRLSALGDVCHVLPVVRTLQDAWPGTRISWILGKLEHKLLGHIADVDFIVFDKKAGLDGYRSLRRQIGGRHYDALLHMQLAIRASLAAALVPARVKIGFDRGRARELQWLFTTDRIEARIRARAHDQRGLLVGDCSTRVIEGRGRQRDVPAHRPTPHAEQSPTSNPRWS